MDIFVTYRREDSSAYAGRLRDALAATFGDHHIFQDVTTIGPGEDFVQAIDAALASADAVLVVIGRSWMAPKPDGTVRLDDPGDYVRIETERALQRDVEVVPVLVGGASLPSEGDLPDVLAPLARRQAVELRDEAWHADVDHLVRALRGQQQAGVRRLWWVAGVVVAVALLAIAVVGVNLLASGDGDGTSAPSLSCETPAQPEWTPVLESGAEPSGTIETPTGLIEVRATDAYYREGAGPGQWEVVVATVAENRTTDVEYNDYWNYVRLDVDRFAFEELACFSTSSDTLEPGEASRAVVGYDVTEDPTGSLRLVVTDGTAEAVIDLRP